MFLEFICKSRCIIILILPMKAGIQIPQFYQYSPSYRKTENLVPKQYKFRPKLTEEHIVQQYKFRTLDPLFPVQV